MFNWLTDLWGRFEDWRLNREEERQQAWKERLDFLEMEVASRVRLFEAETKVVDAQTGYVRAGLPQKGG